MMGTHFLISYGGFTAELMCRKRGVGKEENTAGLDTIVTDLVCLTTLVEFNKIWYDWTFLYKYQTEMNYKHILISIRLPFVLQLMLPLSFITIDH